MASILTFNISKYTTDGFRLSSCRHPSTIALNSSPKTSQTLPNMTPHSNFNRPNPNSANSTNALDNSSLDQDNLNHPYHHADDPTSTLNTSSLDQDNTDNTQNSANTEDLIAYQFPPKGPW